MQVVLPGVTAASHRRHGLHDAACPWPETNCHTDLFIELVHALGMEPAAGLGMTVAQDFEGDQFTFFKMASDDLEALFGLDVQELSIYRPLVDHIEEQAARGRFVLVEVDAHFLPDTRGVTYRTDHSKTTIAVNLFDRASARLGYFHNAGYFEAEGADVEALFGFGAAPVPVLPPYVEFLKTAGSPLSGPALRDAALARFARHWGKRPVQNPVDAYRSALPAHLDRLAGLPPCGFHPYAFNTARQFGANVSLLGAHLDWLSHQGVDGLDAAVPLCASMANAMKTFQFLLARALARKRFDGLDAALAAIARDHDRMLGLVATALGLPHGSQGLRAAS
ncbi:DUF1839 family protein [Phreatobacter sp.]|uniref:DUF1839 family protein n=1 Tax=Phreatobacter sp. TaxID=1966341 RepID=UPI003F710245